MSEKLLTISVACYNVEQYLDECLSSFITKKYMDQFEVLIIDDESSDSTVEIAEGYVGRYPDTFRLIKKKNGGHGSTINVGIEEAAGKYFKVVDGDDWVDTDKFVNLLEALLHTDADIVANNYTWINHTTKKPEKRQEYPFKDIEYGRLYAFSEIVGKATIDMHAMTVKTELLRKANEKIDEHTFYVDAEFIIFPIPYVDTVLFVEDEVYQYRLGLPSQSMSIQKMQKNVKNHMRVLMRLQSFYEKKESELTEDKKAYILNAIATLLTSQIKIYISFPLGSHMRDQAMRLDAYFYHHNREAYDRVTNLAVKAMRKTHYFIFPLAVLAFKYRRNSY